MSDSASPFKLTLDVEADLVECPLKTFVSTWVNSKIFLIQPETVLLEICLYRFL